MPRPCSAPPCSAPPATGPIGTAGQGVGRGGAARDDDARQHRLQTRQGQRAASGPRKLRAGASTSRHWHHWLLTRAGKEPRPRVNRRSSAISKRSHGCRRDGVTVCLWLFTACHGTTTLQRSDELAPRAVVLILSFARFQICRGSQRSEYKSRRRGNSSVC